MSRATAPARMPGRAPAPTLVPTPLLMCSPRAGHTPWRRW
jgi:hypothetical protein